MRGDGIPGLSGHLWYIGVLFKMAVIGLPLGFVIDRFGVGLPIVFLFAYFSGLWPIYSASLFFFTLGGAWAFVFDRHYENRVGKGMLLSCAILLSVGTVVGMLQFPKLLSYSGFLIIYPLAAMCVVWLAYDLREGSKCWSLVDKVAPASFFIYCVHPYFYAASIRSFTGRAIVMLISSLIVYRVMKMYAPRVLAIISGGRS